ncbi:ATP synthase subunit I [Oceanobacillus alkalisoli]|uniref:ATP synthase subunit I n=1 Tax=Oceanobacillus alkalisoli TaxID=2925113 RepID=UPI001EF13CAE|nr:ATP synthase subunit I [Oceanobacillus alkalisoli]MCF3942736.1 ATP synthase subunit I [Oceanobacillus alkalisoli]MCG5102708.1 ATP synthase subunit I [Oceanobacillus alkalisoli]
MNEFESMITRQRKWMLYLLALLVLGVGFLPYTRVFNGLLLGGAISFYNLWLLQHKTKQLGDSVAESGEARGGLGTFSRMAAAVLGVLIAIRYEENFHIIAVVIGLMLSYVILGLDGMLRFVFNKKSR